MSNLKLIPITGDKMICKYMGIVEETLLSDMSYAELKATLVEDGNTTVSAELKTMVRRELNRRALNSDMTKCASDADFRVEVMTLLVGQGFSLHVAANLTNTEAKLMSKAREIGYI